jgi:hypothetical protein
MNSALPDPNDLNPAGVPRQESRDNIFLTAELMFDGASESVTARIRNISAGGMMVDCPANFPIGQKVVAKLRNVGEVAGRIAWSVLPRMGIAFDREVDPKKVRYAPEAPSTPIYAANYTNLPDTTRRPGLGRI